MTSTPSPPRLPRHVAVIMDGNGRWAVERGLPRAEGHRRGADAVRAAVTEACRLGLGYLTLYCFSSENWKRPAAEVGFLMDLLHAFLVGERQLILDQNIRFRVIGRRDGLSATVLAEIDETTRLSAANTGLTLCLAINYGSRAEIVDSCRAVAERVLRGELAPADIAEADIEAGLYTAGMPDVDLLIRTAGELRISNYLLWQVSYAELWVTPACWPDFTPELLHAALADFAARDRRFGGLDAGPG